MSEFILTEEQHKVVHTWGRGICVIAGAGSGKTFTLVQKIRALLLKNKEARFVAVSFTEKSAKELKEKLTDLSLDLFGEGLKNHWVTTIHGLCAHVLKDFPREAGFDGTESQLTDTEAKEYWNRSIEKLWFQELPIKVAQSIDRLLERESYKSILYLLGRLRGLSLGEHFVEQFNDQDLLIVSYYVNESYAFLKKQAGVIDFEDLESGAKRALSFSHVREHYRKKFDLVLVDEFQDTNPTQSQLLKNFCKEGLTNCCVVGDPKQSIYRFRDADVSVFDEFCNEMSEKIILNKNYRSVPGVLNFVNDTCAPLFQASQLEYHPLLAVREDEEGESSIIHLSINKPEDLANYLLSENQKGIDFSEYVLLLRQIKNKADSWLSRLASRGIPLSIESGGLLWLDPRAREIISFLRFYVYRHEEVYGVQFLRSPWLRDSIHFKLNFYNEENDIYSESNPHFSIEQWLDLYLINRARTRSLFDEFLEAPFSFSKDLKNFLETKENVRLGELVQFLLSRDEVVDSLGVILLNIWHQCENLSERGYSIIESIELLTSQMEEELRTGVVSPPDQLGLLRVMTIHGSKGLEFKRIILIEFKDNPKKASATPLLFWDRKRGAYLLDRDEDGNKDKKNLNVISWSEWEKTQELAESKRLFYVALTRAKNQIICVLEPNSTKAPPKKEIDPHYRDYWRKWVNLFLPEAFDLKKISQISHLSLTKDNTNSNRNQFQKVQHLSPLENKFQYRSKRPRHSVSELLKLSLCQRQYVWSVLRELNADQLNPILNNDKIINELNNSAESSIEKNKDFEFSNKNEFEEFSFENEINEFEASIKNNENTLITAQKLSAKKVGTEVHLALEFSDLERLDALKEEAGSSFPINALKEFIIKDRILKSNGDVEIFSELSFETPIKLRDGLTEVLVGSIDRIERNIETGEIKVIDYKVLRKNSSDEDLLNRYGFQLKCYAYAVAKLMDLDPRNVKAELLLFYGSTEKSFSRRIDVKIEDHLVSHLIEQAALLVNLYNSENGLITSLDVPTIGDHCVRCSYFKNCNEAQKIL